MIVDMACPKCGGQSTEYDENKWSCLRCGNKFLYAPVLPSLPSQTFVQSNVHIQGEATFDLDAQNSKQPIPKVVKMFEHDPDHFGTSIKTCADNIYYLKNHVARLKRKKAIALFFIAFIGVVIAMVIHWTLLETADYLDAVIGLTILGLFARWPISAFFRLREVIKSTAFSIQNEQHEISSLEQQNRMDTKIGSYIICPHCEKPLDFVPLDSTPPEEGLKHCLKCGRQYFTSGLISFPVRFNK